jgi:hypothetical protein
MKRYIMQKPWILSKEREMELFIEEMAREMYFRDWRRAMLKVHFIIKLKSI